jgi:hypothetical protein
LRREAELVVVPGEGAGDIGREKLRGDAADHGVSVTAGNECWDKLFGRRKRFRCSAELG